jgi:predicted DCC family thiol-disulfide oxidoreductase YuxK
MIPDEGATSAHLERPLLLFDGDCGFCRFWVRRWQSKTRGRVDFAPAQQEAARFPQVTEQDWKRAVQLVMPDGTVHAGAEAVFTALAQAPRHGWMLAAYRRVPGVRPASEAFYRLVAGHRDFFFHVTRLAWGRDPQPSSYVLSRWLFLRLLGLVYVIAFLSLRVQITGLIGSDGILPAGALLRAAQQGYGPGAYRLFPTLAWISSSDAALKLFCSLGAVFGLLAMLGLLTLPALIGAWAFYLSLVTVGQDFLSFQWDALLLEAGFLAIFLAPPSLAEAPWRHGFPAVSRTVLWLERWLLFRLMFLSGAVKLLSGDPTWRNLTALDYHYWTQPLPTPVAWYAAQLPEWFQKVSVIGVFAVELAVPFLIFAPRRFRHFGALCMIGLELLIALTGNYCFFNLLTIALCVLLLDDSFLLHRLPTGLAARLGAKAATEKSAFSPGSAGKVARAALAAIVLTVSGAQMLQVFGQGDLVPSFVRQWPRRLAPFDMVNSYGLFAVMTTSRFEIVVEGSNDGQNWQAYEFKYKPGDPARRPPWVAPYQPRLDWQMWFAALGNYQAYAWFRNFMTRLLQGSPETTALLARNPFSDQPPRYIRAVAYAYKFTDSATRRATGDWWQREREGLYFPEASLRGR